MPRRREPIGQTKEEIAPPWGVEVDRHVATEDHVERADLGKGLQEIAALEGDHTPDFVLDLPAAGMGRKVFRQE